MGGSIRVDILEIRVANERVNYLDCRSLLELGVGDDKGTDALLITTLNIIYAPAAAGMGSGVEVAITIEPRNTYFPARYEETSLITTQNTNS